MGNDKEALECFTNALKLNPKSVEIWYDKGVAFKYLGKTQEALECFDKALELDPDYEPAKQKRKEILDSES